MNTEMLNKMLEDLIDPTLLEEKIDTSETPPYICFVCTGNTCRSPMAAAVYNHLGLTNFNKPNEENNDTTAETETESTNEEIESNGEETKKFRRAISAGIFAYPGMRISEGAKNALKDAGIPSAPENDYENHRAQMLTLQIIEKCEIIIAMTQSHAMQMISMFPQHASKIYTMPEDIADPYGQDDAVYKKTLEQIIDLVQHNF